MNFKTTERFTLKVMNVTVLYQVMLILNLFFLRLSSVQEKHWREGQSGEV